MKKKVAIISFVFPPFPGIGGRRWAKFSHYLSLKGYDIDIVCAQNPFNEISFWDRDTKAKNIHIHYLPLMYPKILLKVPKNLAGKIKYQFWKMVLSLYSRGTIFERSIFWKKELNKTITKLIQTKEINNVIVSVPPFRLAFYAHLVKKKIPNINFIVDYRDPWTDNKTFHGFKDITNSRLQNEKKMEQEVLNIADHIFTVSDKMTEDLKKRSKYPAKISTLPNGFDPRDIPIFKNNLSELKEQKRIELIYAGTLYNNLEYIFRPLLSYLFELKKTNINLYNSISFKFYGIHNKELKEIINHIDSSAISIHDPVSLVEIQQIIQNSTFGVLMSAPDHSFAFNTKFYEYLSNNKPILLFSNKGETSDFIVRNRLGFHVNPNTLKKDMDYLWVNMSRIIEGFNDKFDINPYSIQNITIELEKWLK